MGLGLLHLMQITDRATHLRKHYPWSTKAIWSNVGLKGTDMIMIWNAAFMIFCDVVTGCHDRGQCFNLSGYRYQVPIPSGYGGGPSEVKRTQIGIIGFAEIRRDAKGRVCPSTWHWPYHLQASAAPCSAKFLCCWAFFHDWTSCLHVSYRWHLQAWKQKVWPFQRAGRRPGHPAMKPFVQMNRFERACVDLSLRSS